ncbi:MAG: PDZ domain-containing protein [Vicinamibacterales bacterium]
MTDRQARRGWVRSSALFAVGLTLGTWANDRGSALRAVPVRGRVPPPAESVLADLTPEAARRLDLAPGSPGAVVRAVAPGSTVARAALRVDDVILEIDHRPVRGAAGGRVALQAAFGAGPMTMRVWRSGRPLLLTLQRP